MSNTESNVDVHQSPIHPAGNDASVAIGLLIFLSIIFKKALNSLWGNIKKRKSYGPHSSNVPFWLGKASF